MCLDLCQPLRLGAHGSASRPSISRPGTRCRLPIPPSPEHACFTPPAAVLALMGSPLVSAQTPDTALDFRSGVDPCGRMALRIPGLIHQCARDPISSPMRLPALEAVARHNPPWSQKCADGAGSHVFIFKTDRAGPCTCAWLAQPLGRRHAVWSRVLPCLPDHPLQRMTESVAGVGLPGFLTAPRSGGAPLSSPGKHDDDTLNPTGRFDQPRADPWHGSTAPPSLGGQVAPGNP